MMGSPIATRLAMKGHKITVFNRDRSKAEKLNATRTKKLTHLVMSWSGADRFT